MTEAERVKYYYQYVKWKFINWFVIFGIVVIIGYLVFVALCSANVAVAVALGTLTPTIFLPMMSILTRPGPQDQFKSEYYKEKMNAQ